MKPATSSAAPNTFTATAGVGEATLAWTLAPHNEITKWQYRQKTTGAWGSWQDIAGGATRSHTVTGLTTGTAYTFQVRAVYGITNSAASAEQTITVEEARALLDMTMTVGVSGNVAGYSRHGNRNFGSVGENSFSWGGTDHTLTEFLTYQNGICVRTDPMLALAFLNALVITVGGRTFEGDWSTSAGGDACRSKDGLSLTEGDKVVAALTVPIPNGPDACHYHILDRLIPFSAPSGPVWPWHGFPRR